jgi:hypothetical protein
MHIQAPSYDLTVAYRIYPGVSKAAIGLPLGDDKFKLSELCLKSFRESLGTLRVKIWAILDGCPDEYEGLFRKYVPSADLVIVRLDRVGNGASFGKQIDILLGQDDAGLVYFAEDDYFYLPGQVPEMLEFISANSDVHFVSPYDHLDCYLLDLHRTRKWIRVHASHHWMTAASTCLTFLTRKETLAKYESIFRSYQRGNNDCGLWLALTKERVFNPFVVARHIVRQLPGWRGLPKAWRYCWRQIAFGRKENVWVPIPGIATHLNRSLLSPTVDWCALMNREAETMVDDQPTALELS